MLLAALAHTLAHGAGPSAAVVGGLVVALTVMLLPLAERERSLAGITATTVGLQVALHIGFSLTAAKPPTATGSGVFAGIPLDRLWCHTAGASTGASLLSGGAMLAGHLVAALALAVLLRRGEAALWSLVRLPRRVLLRLLTLLRPLVPHARESMPAWPADRLAALRGTRLRHALVLRGPPLPA